MKKCINCKNFVSIAKRNKTCIGICSLYAKEVKDSLCGCEYNVERKVVILKNFN